MQVKSLLSQAENEFSKGHYSRVKTLVDEATISIGNNASNPFPVYAIIGGIAIANTVSVSIGLRKKIIHKRLRVEIEHDSVGGPLSDDSSDRRPPPAFVISNGVATSARRVGSACAHTWEQTDLSKSSDPNSCRKASSST